MVLIAVFFLFDLCWRTSDGAVLPQWVYRINSCPDPNNISMWITASKRINCLHNLTSVDSNEQASVYHCLSSSFLNETVEFCGRNVPVSQGHCPIYNYKVAQNTRPTYYTCSNFTSGCPSAMFNSKEVYKHPECLEIDSNMKCFKAEKNCAHESTLSTSTRKRTTTEKQTIITISIKGDTNSSLWDPSDIIENLRKKHAQERKTLIIIISTISPVLIGICIISLILYRRNYNVFKFLNRKKSTFISGRELLELKQKQNQCFEEIAMHAENGNNEEEGRTALLSNMYNDAKLWQYNNFLQNLKKGMTAEIVNFIKCRLQEQRENGPDDLSRINEPTDLLKYLEDKYNTFYNVVYLQGIFLACKAPKLYDRCVEYAKSRGEEIMYFEKRLLERDHTKVIYVINCPDISSYSRTELEKLQVIVATLLKAQFDDVIVSGVKNGCVIVTFMIRNYLISKLRAFYTPEKRSMTCQMMLKLPLKFKVLKVIVQDETIYPSDDVLPRERSNADEKPSEKIQDVPLNSNEEIERTASSVEKVSKILECNDNASSNLKVGNILECNDNATSNLQKRDFATDIVKGKPSQGLQEFHAFLERTGSCITDDTLHAMKTVLRDMTHLENLIDQERVCKTDATRMLNELSDTLKLQYNMRFLEWIFEKCEDHQLVEKCRKFSAGYIFNLECFQTNFIACGQNQHLKFQLMMTELESHTSDVQELRNWLATSINVHPGQIIMTALQSGPIVVTFMMKEAYIKTFLRYIKTDDGQIAASWRRVQKVIKNETVISIDKALNGSNFIHVHLCYQKNCFESLGGSVRTVASNILRETGMSLDEDEVFVRHVQPESKEKGHASCWMQDNQELLKKINLFEGDPNKVFTSRPWMDQRKGKKKEEAKLFQEFDHGKRLRGLTETCIDAKRYQYKDFLQTLTREITPDMFNNIKCRLKERKENNPDVVDSIHEPYDLLLHLEEKYNVFYNLKFLQGIFLSCKAWKLFDRCVEYAKTRGEEIEYFERRILESDHTKVTYIINCPNVSEYNLSELEKLRSILEVSTKGQYDDIIVAGVKTGCVIVTLMIRNCLIPNLRKLYTSEKGSMTCQWMLKLPLKYKIMKVMIQDDLIYMSDAFFSMDKLTAEANLSGGALKSVQEKKRIGFSLDKVHKTVECNDNLAITLEKSDLKKDIMIENEAQQLEEFTTFLERTSSCITDDTLHSMKTVLKDFMDPESVVKMNTTRMLSELSELFKLQYNMSFLEWIFEKCGEHDLVEKCQKFSAGNHFQLECFNTSFIPRGGNQQLQFQLVVLELKSYTNEIQDLRKWVAKAILAHPGQIIMTALESEPIVVTFMMSKKHAKAIMKFLHTDDGQIAASRKRIKEILNNGQIIKIAKALNGSNFVHVRLRYQRNTCEKLEDNIRRATQRIIQHTGLSMEGKEICIRISDSKEKVRSIESSEHFFEKNKKCLLEEIEPMDILKSEIASLFDTNVTIKMENYESRKERADYFLGICINLPPDKNEMVVKYLKKSIPKTDGDLNSKELGYVKCWIHKHRKTLLDEIDSDFIKTTLVHMEDVPTEVCNSLTDTKYGRRRMAQMFLEFVLKKDDYVLALHKTWKENGMDFEMTE